MQSVDAHLEHVEADARGRAGERRTFTLGVRMERIRAFEASDPKPNSGHFGLRPGADPFCSAWDGGSSAKGLTDRRKPCKASMPEFRF